MSATQWWLAKLDRHGNPTLVDGAHSERAGADRAFYLCSRLGLDKAAQYAVAKVELSEPIANAEGTDQEALQALNTIGLKP